MLYMAIGGVWLMFLYKGINTMDSMLGYKNDKYLYFGRCAQNWMIWPIIFQPDFQDG